MKKILLALTLIIPLGLGGCANLQRLQDGFEAITTTTVSPKAIVIGANSFNALEATATNYLNLTRCDKTTSKVCRDREVTKVLGPAVLNARKARNDLIAFQRQHPGQLGTQGLYDALQLSVTTLAGIIETYHIRSVAR